MAGAPRYVLWQQRYRKDRYCQHLDDNEVRCRFRDIFLNMLTVNSEGKIGPPDIASAATWTLTEKFTHIVEEARLRFGPFPSGLDNALLESGSLPNFASEMGTKAGRALSRLDAAEGEVIVKYGKREHIQALHERGQILLRPASYYRDTSHNGAVRDDELALQVALAADDQVRALLKDRFGMDVGGDGRIDINWRLQGDYLMFCASRKIDPRMFIDFEADSCLFIRDQRLFSDRLKNAVMEQGPFNFRRSHVVYMDPQLPETAKIDLPFYKHFRYTYQNEYRYVWEPFHSSRELHDELITIGSLADIAEPVFGDDLAG